MKNISEANAIAVFNGSTFTDEIKMDNFSSQSWKTTVYEFQPFAENKGKLKFDATIDEKKSIWSVSLPSNSEVKPKSYSSAFAITRIKMAQDMAPHRRFRPPKSKDKETKARTKK